MPVRRGAAGSCRCPLRRGTTSLPSPRRARRARCGAGRGATIRLWDRGGRSGVPCRMGPRYLGGCAPVAQLDRASASGAEGPAFESRLAHSRMRHVVSLLTALLSLALTAGPDTWHPPDRPEIAWHPAPPLQGSLVVLSVKAATPPPPGGPVTGTLAGEPLHFESHSDSVAVALGAVPLSARDSIVAHVVIGGTDTFAVDMPVAPRQVERESLRTAPRFTRRPDAALAARLERERALLDAALAETHSRPRLRSEPFVRPRPGPIRSEFGLEREFNGVLESRHLGIDFAGRRGAPVRAANRGVVTLVAPLFYSGRTI